MHREFWKHCETEIYYPFVKNRYRVISVYKNIYTVFNTMNVTGEGREIYGYTYIFSANQGLTIKRKHTILLLDWY